MTVVTPRYRQPQIRRPSARATAKPRATSKTPHPAVARIIVPERGATSYGSGTLVHVQGKHGLVITNWHVVRDAASTPIVVFPDGFRSGAKVLKVDRVWDLALLAIFKPPAKPVKIADHDAHMGELLTIAGYGSGNYRQATGKLTRRVAPGPRQPHDMLEISTEARQGDSGGPILNQQGEIAGVLWGAGPGRTEGSRAARVRSFLASVIPKLPAGVDDSRTQIAAKASPPRSKQQPRLTGVSPRERDPIISQKPLAAVAALPQRPKPALPSINQPKINPPKQSLPKYAASPLPRYERAMPKYAAVAARVEQPKRPPHDTLARSAVTPLPTEGQPVEAATTSGQDFDLSELLGSTTTEQTKTFLAIMGSLAVGMMFMRLFVRN